MHSSRLTAVATRLCCQQLIATLPCEHVFGPALTSPDSSRTGSSGVACTRCTSSITAAKGMTTGNGQGWHGPVRGQPALAHAAAKGTCFRLPKVPPLPEASSVRKLEAAAELSSWGSAGQAVAVRAWQKQCVGLTILQQCSHPGQSRRPGTVHRGCGCRRRCR